MAKLELTDLRDESPADQQYRIGLPEDTIAPSVPANLLATRASTQVALTWDASFDANGVDHYGVYRGGTLIAAPTVTSYVDTGRTDGVAYTYSVTALDLRGNESAHSTAVSSTPNPPGIPSAPLNLVASAGFSQVLLTEDEVADNGGAPITDRVWQYRITGAGGWTTFAHSPDNARFVTITGLTNDTSYDFRSAAVNSFGTGPFSTVVTATPTQVNLLTANEASVEIDGTAWVAGNANTLVAQSTVVSMDGSASLALTQTGAVGLVARALSSHTLVTPGQSYSALASVRGGAGVPGRSCYVAIAWIASDGVTVISTSTPVLSTDSNAGPTDLASGTVVAPVGAARCRPVVGIATATSPALGETHYYDKFGIFNGARSAGTWVAP